MIALTQASQAHRDRMFLLVVKYVSGYIPGLGSAIEKITMPRRALPRPFSTNNDSTPYMNISDCRTRSILTGTLPLLVIGPQSRLIAVLGR